ncbi:hypothetical protein I552_10228, partial [Mycobacterium xenopi 3993]
PTPMSDLTSQGRVRCRGGQICGHTTGSAVDRSTRDRRTALDALTPDEQHELLDKTRYIYDQLGPVSTRGRRRGFRPNAQGLRRTLRRGWRPSCEGGCVMAVDSNGRWMGSESAMSTTQPATQRTELACHRVADIQAARQIRVARARGIVAQPAMTNRWRARSRSSATAPVGRHPRPAGFRGGHPRGAYPAGELPRAPRLPIMFTVEGHMSNMFARPVADTATQLESEGVCHTSRSATTTPRCRSTTTAGSKSWHALSGRP